MNVFEKIKKVRGVVSSVYPEIGVEELTKIVGFLANSWHGKKRKRQTRLTPKQAMIYDLLIRNGYNPATVYKWLLLATGPKEVREQIKDNSTSIIKGLKQRKESRKALSVDEKKFIKEVIKCIEMFVSEPGEGYPGKVEP